MGKKVDLIGHHFNRLTVIECIGRTPYGEKQRACRCDCGKEVVVRTSRLLNGSTSSCGCYRNEQLGNYSRSHGKSYSRLYKIWTNMKQ